MSDKLFGSDNEDCDDCKLLVNNAYSEKYEAWRAKEESQRSKDKKGRLEIGNDDDDDDSDDQDVLASPNVDKTFLKAYAMLKRRDPKIYDSKFVAFPNTGADNQKKSSEKRKKHKLFTLRDAEIRQAFVEENGEINSLPDKRQGRNYYDKLEKSKKAFINAERATHDTADNDDDDFMKMKSTEEMDEKEHDRYASWLNDKYEETSKDLSWLKSYWQKSNLNQKETFLRDYIVEKKYLDKGSRKNNYAGNLDEEFDEEEDMLEREDEFERNYNYRFEEPEKDFIKSYPRHVEKSVRKTNDKRKEERQKHKDRKVEEMSKFREEINRVKAAKKKELEARLKQLKEITGDSTFGLDVSNMDEFDSEKYEKRMNDAFDDGYYAVEEHEKPDIDWEDDDLNIEHNEPDDEFEFNNGSTCQPVEETEMNIVAGAPKKSKRQLRKEKRKRKRQTTELEGHAADDPMTDEVNRMDFEDVVAGIPCRFKYRQVPTNDFGLDLNEIMDAEDKELNKWVSLKKIVEYRSDKDEKFDQHAYETRRSNMKKKKKILKSIYDPEMRNEEKEGEVKTAPSKVDLMIAPISDERLKAYGINPNKYKRSQKYGGVQRSQEQ